MPWKARQSCEVFAESEQWDLVAAEVLEWAIQDRELTSEQKVAALAFVREGMFGSRSAYLEHRLSSYRSPIWPAPSRTT